MTTDALSSHSEMGKTFRSYDSGSIDRDYFSPDGEALDLTQNPPTYANVKLFKVE